MIDHPARDARRVARVPRTAAALRDDRSVLPLRRVQPPPTRQPAESWHPRRSWVLGVAAVLLAGLVPVASVIGIQAGESGTRVLVACAIPVLAGSALATAARAPVAGPSVRSAGPRSRP